MLDERAAGVGQPHAAAAAVDERGARLLLERGDLLGDGGLGVGERVGGGGERAVLGDRLENPQLLDIEHNESLSQPTGIPNLNLWRARSHNHSRVIKPFYQGDTT